MDSPAPSVPSSPAREQAVPLSDGPSAGTSRASSYEDLKQAKDYFDSVVAHLDGEEGSLETLIRVYESLPIEERPLPTIWKRMKKEVELREARRIAAEAAARPNGIPKRRPRTMAEQRLDFARLQHYIEASYDPRDSLPASPISSPGSAVGGQPSPYLMPNNLPPPPRMYGMQMVKIQGPAFIPGQGIPRRSASYDKNVRTPSPIERLPQILAEPTIPEETQEGFVWGSEPPPMTEAKPSKCCVIL